MHSLKRFLRSIVGSTATNKSTTSMTRSNSNNRSIDIPNNQYPHQLHHYHHQKVFEKKKNDFFVWIRRYFIKFLFFFLFLFSTATTVSFIFYNNAIKFKSGFTFIMFGRFSGNIIILVTLR